MTQVRTLSAPVVWVVDTGSPRWHDRLSLRAQMGQTGYAHGASLDRNPAGETLRMHVVVRKC